jgi:hypothetical protein
VLVPDAGDLLNDDSRLLPMLGVEVLKPSAAKGCIARAKVLAKSLGQTGIENGTVLADLIDRMVIAESDVTVALSPGGLSKAIAMSDGDPVVLAIATNLFGAFADKGGDAQLADRGPGDVPVAVG